MLALRVGLTALLLLSSGCSSSAEAVRAPAAAAPAKPPAEEIRYCRGTVTYWDADECLRRLTELEARRADYVIVLFFRDGRLVARESRRGVDWLRDDGTGYDCGRRTFEHDAAGKLRKSTCRDRHGHVTEGHQTDPSGARHRWLDPFGEPQRPVAGLDRTFDERGRVVGYCYFDADGKRTHAKSGVHCVRVRLDDRGSRLEERYVDETGRVEANEHGVHRVARVVDEHGGELERSCWAMDGAKVACGDDGYQRRVSELDDVGNTVRHRYFDVDGKPSVPVARVDLVFDDHGRLVELSRVGTDGRLALGRGQWARRRVAYDDRGRFLLERFYDAGDRPVALHFGHHAYGVAYDELDRVVERAYFGVDMQLTTTTDGYAFQQIARDERDNVVLERHFAPDGMPVVVKAGYHALRNTYDDHDRLIIQRYFDEQDQPRRNRRGNARMVIIRDRDGRVSETRFYDAAGAKLRVVSYEGIAFDGADARAAAQAALERIRAGANPSEVAKVRGSYFSEDTVAWDYTALSIRPALETLSPGEMSEVIDVPNGALLVRHKLETE